MGKTNDDGHEDYAENRLWQLYRIWTEDTEIPEETSLRIKRELRKRVEACMKENST